MNVIAIYNASTPTKYPQGAKMVKKNKKKINKSALWVQARETHDLEKPKEALF
jgi:hypothetical protein